MTIDDRLGDGWPGKPGHGLHPPVVIAEGGISLEARWSSRWHGAGPARVTIEITEDADESARARGVTTGVLRRAEAMLQRALADWSELGETAAQEFREDLEADVRDRIAAMPNSPRAEGTAYYTALDELYGLVQSSGVSTAPLAWLATEMKISRNTLSTRLQTARRRRAER